MKRAHVLWLAAGILVVIGTATYEVGVTQNYIPLVYNDWVLYPAPDESITRSFNTEEKTDLIFFVDYSPLGNKIEFQITNSNDEIVFQDKLNSQFLNSPIKLEPDTYYVAKITNKGSEQLEIYDMGFLFASDFEGGKKLVVPFEETYTIVPLALWFVGIFTGIAGAILYCKDRKKKIN